ncbi:MAG TPA: aspartate/glutamate racemase family protein [Acidimicrobiia bacterium]|nr:aspartate/glutamate racemase family protein [Acidimicrobiia bacterium]
MKRIGLLGGMSWESSVEYERLINTEVRKRLGGSASGDLVVRSYNFAVIQELQEADRWDDAGALLAADAVTLVAAGAELIALCTNTMHRVAPAIEEAIDVPFLHIADATSAAIHGAAISTVGLLGTRYTMEQEFYRGRLERRGIDVVVPEDADRTVVHDTIFDELVRGIISDASRSEFLRVVDGLVDRGAEGIVAGCTEIELLVGPDDLEVPYFPTTALHARALVDASLA